MNFLLVLLSIQFLGVILTFSTSFYLASRERKKMQLTKALQNYLDNNEQNWDWMIDYLKTHPDSSLRSMFPGLYKVARVIKLAQKQKQKSEAGAKNTNGWN